MLYVCQFLFTFRLACFYKNAPLETGLKMQLWATQGDAEEPHEHSWCTWPLGFALIDKHVPTGTGGHEKRSRQWQQGLSRKTGFLEPHRRPPASSTRKGAGHTRMMSGPGLIFRKGSNKGHFGANPLVTVASPYCMNGTNTKDVLAGWVAIGVTVTCAVGDSGQVN